MRRGGKSYNLNRAEWEKGSRSGYVGQRASTTCMRSSSAAKGSSELGEVAERPPSLTRGWEEVLPELIENVLEYWLAVE
jgi:hypothetical protein